MADDQRGDAAVEDIPLDQVGAARISGVESDHGQQRRQQQPAKNLHESVAGQSLAADRSPFDC